MHNIKRENHLDITKGAEIQNPPRSFLGIVKRLGPGLIIAGSIVGSGELIATTRTGAEAGFTLLWLILIGCIIKVFVQVELGRYTVVNGLTTMEGLDSLPGPRFRVNWALWFWFVMFVVSIAQLGGIVGGVGQAIAIAQPLTASGYEYNYEQDLVTKRQVANAILQHGRTTERQKEALRAELEQIPESRPRPATGHDDIIWALILTVVTTLLLIIGRYGFIQNFSMLLVAAFTFVSIGTVFQLQNLEFWRISFDEIRQGLSFHLPRTSEGDIGSSVFTALAAFGIIGVGATELIQYPYWCLEKGYAKWTGKPDSSAGWLKRARGWMSVMKWDAWFSAIIYTFATVVFYLLGAAVIGRVGLIPEGTAMIRTLTEMYVPVFGEVAQSIFLFGAISVLYSTFFVSIAGHARVCADAMRVFSLSDGSEESFRKWTTIFSALFPFVSFLFYISWRQPVVLILASGVMQALMLPVLGGAALFFRYRNCHESLKPGRLWDLFLWMSAFGLLVAGLWLASTRIF